MIGDNVRIEAIIFSIFIDRVAWIERRTPDILSYSNYFNGKADDAHRYTSTGD